MNRRGSEVRGDKTKTFEPALFSSLVIEAAPQVFLWFKSDTMYEMGGYACRSVVGFHVLTGWMNR